MSRGAGRIPTHWRRGAIATLLLHGAAGLALVTQVRGPAPFKAPAFAVELAVLPASLPSPQDTAPKPSAGRPAQVSPRRQPVPVMASHDAVVARQQVTPVAPTRMTTETQAEPSPAPVQGAPDEDTNRPHETPVATVPLAAQPAAQSRASSSQPVSDASANAHASWEAQVLAQLEAGKRYPAPARFAEEEGTVYVTFTVDGEGRAHDIRLARSSSYGDLDQESLALLRRVHLPPPPAGFAIEDAVLTVPINYALR
jgi:periplasmic protein TonB